MIFDGLFASNAYGAPVPELAEEVIISFDDLEYVLRLRDDVLWHDGVAFSADDVLFTMNLLADPAYAAYSAASQFWQTVETQKLGEHLVRFRLAQPLGSFPLRLTIGILPEHVLRGTTVEQLASHPFNLSPIGTGAYQLGGLMTNGGGAVESVKLQASPAHQQRLSQAAMNQLHELEFRLYRSEADAIDAFKANRANSLANIGSRSGVLSLPNARVYTSLRGSLQTLIMNWESHLLSDRRMRRALSLTLDLPRLIARRFGGEVAFADSPLLPGMTAYAPDEFWRQHDAELAAVMLEAALAAHERDETETESDAETTGEAGLAYTLVAGGAPPLPQLAADIAAAWSGLGLDITVEALDAAALESRLREGDFDMAIVEQRIGSDPDVYRFWHPSQAGGENYGRAAQDEIAELLDTARRLRDGIARQEHYQAFQRVFAEQALAIPLYYPLYTLAVSHDVTGIRLGLIGNGADRFRDVSQWRISGLAS